MLNVFTASQAKKAARALEKALARQGLDLPHGKALDAVASLQGHADWNSMASALQPAMLDEQLLDIERTHIDLNSDTTYGPESILVVHTGFQLRYSSETETCDYVRVCDPQGREVAYWVSDEWQQDPTVVMGALLGALGRGVMPSVPKVVTSPKKQASSQTRAPRISDVDFTAMSRMSIGGEFYQVRSVENDLLSLLANPASASFKEKANEIAVWLYEQNEELEEFEESLTLEQLAGLTWNAARQCFVDAKGVTYEFFFPVTTAQFLALAKVKKGNATGDAACEPEQLEGKPYVLYDVTATLTNHGAELPITARVAGRSVKEARQHLERQYPGDDMRLVDVVLVEYPLSQPLAFAVYIDGGLYLRDIPHLATAIGCAELMADQDPDSEVVVEDESGNNIWAHNLEHALTE